jgi:hypothetical protein
MPGRSRDGSNELREAEPLMHRLSTQDPLCLDRAHLCSTQPPLFVPTGRTVS